MTEQKRRSKDRLPKDVSQLTAEQVLEKVFPKKVVNELKKAAHEKDTESEEKDS